MNGIAGLVRLDGGVVDPREIEAPMRAMESARPRIAVSAQAAFACDEASRAIWPPVVTRRGGRMIVADARLDDRAALAARLGVSGDGLGVTTDADLLLESYARWGAACVDHLYGDFAFAIWDAENGSLFAARDHIGARSFYYAAPAGRLVFASSVPGVLAFDGVHAAIDEAQIARLLLSETNGYFDPEYTFFSGVRKLPFGHRMTATADSVVVERYWHPERLPPVILRSDADYARRLRELAELALEDRLRGVAHSAVHVSGGLDSTALAVLTHRTAAARGRRVTALSWLPAPSHERGQEHDRLDDLARATGLTPVYAPVRVADRWRFDADISLGPRITFVATQQVVEAAVAADAQVITSGWGGDDAASFAGGGIPAGWLARGRWLTLARYCRDRAALVRSTPARVAWQEALIPWLPQLLWQMWDRRAHPRGPRLVNPDLIRRVRERLRPPIQRTAGPSSGRAMLMQRYYGGWMTGRIESWSEFRATHGATHIYPLTDRRLLEFVYGSPERLHVRGGLRRALFYDALADVLPTGPAWRSAKREDSIRALFRRYSNAADRARILADLEGLDVPRPHPWVDIDRLRAAIRATPNFKPFPATVQHALQALVIWRRWCAPIDTTSRQPE